MYTLGLVFFKCLKIYIGYVNVKGILHTKMKMLSSFTHPHVIPYLYEFLFYVEHKRRYFEH